MFPLTLNCIEQETNTLSGVFWEHSGSRGLSEFSGRYKYLRHISVLKEIVKSYFQGVIAFNILFNRPYIWAMVFEDNTMYKHGVLKNVGSIVKKSFKWLADSPPPPPIPSGPCEGLFP